MKSSGWFHKLFGVSEMTSTLGFVHSHDAKGGRQMPKKGLEALNPWPVGQVGEACVSHNSPLISLQCPSDISISFGGAPPPAPW